MSTLLGVHLCLSTLLGEGHLYGGTMLGRYLCWSTLSGTPIWGHYARGHLYKGTLLGTHLSWSTLLGDTCVEHSAWGTLIWGHSTVETPVFETSGETLLELTNFWGDTRKEALCWGDTC